MTPGSVDGGRDVNLGLPDGIFAELGQPGNPLDSFSLILYFRIGR